MLLNMWFVRCLAGGITGGIAVAVRLALDPILGSVQPGATVVTATAFAACFGRWLSGLVALATGLLGVVFLVLEPRGEFAVIGTERQTSLAMSVACGLVLIGLFASVRKGVGASDAADRSRPPAIDGLSPDLERRIHALAVAFGGPAGAQPVPHAERDVDVPVRVGLPPPRRLLHLLAYAPRGTRAIDRLVLELARYARPLGWHVTFGFTAPPPAEFATKLAALGAGWLVFRHPFRWREVNALRRELAGRRPEVVQTSFFSPFEPPVLWLKLSGFARRLIVLDHASGIGPPARGPMALLRRVRGWAVGRVVDAVAPVSGYVARRAVERVFLPAGKVVPIPNGLDPDLYPCPDRPTGGPTRVVYAGQLIPEKGVSTLLDALARLRNAGVGPLEVFVAGAGAQRAELEAAAADHGLTEVKFLGHVDHVPALFAAADVVVVPSVWAEAFGYVAAEAMACGAAVIVSSAGALPEVVGDAGLVFRSGDAGDLADKLRALIESPQTRRRLGAAGRRRVESHWRLSRKVLGHFALCTQVMSR